MAPLSHHIRRHAAKVRHHFWNAFVPHEGNDHRPHALRHKALTVYAVTIITVKVIVSGFVALYPGPSATADLIPVEIIRLTNEARTSKGVTSLATNRMLATGAQYKADDMLAKQYFAHVSPEKVSPWFWFKKAGYTYSAAGENLAIDFTTAEDVVEAWLASPGHRKNLLNPNYKDIGVSVETGPMNGVSSTVVVQFFGVAVAPKQQPKPVKKVTPVKPKVAQKPSSVQKTNPAPIPPKPVLGEQTSVPPPVPPAVPVLTLPSSGTVIATSEPWLAGESQAGVVVTLYDNGNRIGGATSDANGFFSLQPDASLSDGTHQITAVATKDSLSSVASDGLSFTVDTKPPSAALGTTIVLPSYLNPGALTVIGSISGDDVSSARITIGEVTADIASPKGTFMAEVQEPVNTAAESIDIELKDVVGNVSVVPLASLSFLDTPVVQASERVTVAEWVSRIVFFSRRFFITFWLFIFLALAMNVIVKIRVQHRPMILYSLLLLYGLTIVMITT